MTNRTVSEGLRTLLSHIAQSSRTDAYASFNLKTGKGYQMVNGLVTEGIIKAHVDGTQPIAVYPVLRDTVHYAVLDIDVHDGELEWDEVVEKTLPILMSLWDAGYQFVAFRSGGGKGVHIWVLFDAPQKAKDVRLFLQGILEKTGFTTGTGGLAKGEIEIYPKQDSLDEGRMGNAIALPLSRDSVLLDKELQPASEEVAEKFDIQELMNSSVPRSPDTVGSINGHPPRPIPIPDTVLAGDEVEVQDALRLIPSDDYDLWVKVGFALKAAFGEVGYAIWAEWSQQSAKYPGHDEAQQKWQTFPDSRGIGLGTIFFLARERGWNGPSDPVIRQMNAKYGQLTQKNASLVILKDKVKGSPDVLDYLTKEAFKDRLRSETIEIEGPDGKGKVIPVSEYWLRHKKRDAYHSVIFDPSLPPGKSGKAWNVWRGFAVKRRPGGSWELLKKHIRDNICKGDLRLYEWLLNWMALGVQEPALVIGTAPLFMGAPGTGKGVVARAYAHLWGIHATTVTHREQVVGRFGGHLLGMRFVFLDEAMFGGDRKDIGVIKTRITEPYVQIERKGVDAQLVKNVMIFMAASNEMHAVSADVGDRRWQVLMVSDNHREDHQYFGAIVKELEEGGYEAMLDELLKRDLSKGPDPRATIKNDALFEQMILSQGPAVRYLYRVLCSGSLPQPEAVGNGPGVTTIAAMLQELKSMESAPYESLETLGRFITKVVPSIRKQQHGTFIKIWGTQERPDVTERSTRYSFPPLEECRRMFEAYVGMPVDWPDHPTEWVDELGYSRPPDPGDAPF